MDNSLIPNPPVNVRVLPEYLGMTILQAIDIIETDNVPDPTGILTNIAWQWLVDTGMAWELQGSYQRMARKMLDMGLLEEKE